MDGMMKLSKLKRFMDDIAYVCGVVFIYYERYLSQGGNNDTRSQKEVVKEFKKKLWLEVHEERVKERARAKR